MRLAAKSGELSSLLNIPAQECMRILIAEDDPVSRMLLQSHLVRWGFEVETVQDGLAALEALQDCAGPTLAILDWVMPGLNGIDVCRKIRQLPGDNYRYLLLVTGRDAKQDVIEGLEAGADDYLVKPLSPAELRARLRAGQRILRLQAQLLATQHELRVQATRDVLTGLWNRRAILELLNKEIARAGRDGTTLGLILGDIDHFKAINDRCGHAGGDAVLREIAARITGSVRDYDSVGRYGGEELLIVLPNCGRDAVLTVAERIRADVAALPFTAESWKIPGTISMGALVSDGSTPAADLINQADVALYQAKANGRNCVQIAPASAPTFSPEPPDGERTPPPSGREIKRIVA